MRGIQDRVPGCVSGSSDGSLRARHRTGLRTPWGCCADCIGPRIPRETPRRHRGRNLPRRFVLRPRRRRTRADKRSRDRSSIGSCDGSAYLTSPLRRGDLLKSVRCETLKAMQLSNGAHHVLASSRIPCLKSAQELTHSIATPHSGFPRAHRVTVREHLWVRRWLPWSNAAPCAYLTSAARSFYKKLTSSGGTSPKARFS